MDGGNILQELATGSDQVKAILAYLVLVLSAAIVTITIYVSKKTVPKWVWDQQVQKLEALVKLVEKLDTILTERGKK